MADRDDGFGGLIIGLLAGLAIGFLVAPRSGRETRERLSRRSRRVLDSLDSSVDQLRDDLGTRIEGLRDLASDLGGEAREESQALIKKAEALKRDLASSTAKLARETGKARTTVAGEVKRLQSEGSEVLQELERLTRRMVSVTKAKVSSDYGRD